MYRLTTRIYFIIKELAVISLWMKSLVYKSTPQMSEFNNWKFKKSNFRDLKICGEMARAACYQSHLYT